MRTRLFALLPLLCLAAATARAEEPTLAAWKKALAWLGKAQLADGTFSKGRGKIGMTAILVHALARAPEGARDAAADAMLLKAADALVAAQRKDGKFDGAIADPGAPANYCTALSILALSTFDATRYRPVIDKAVAWIRQQQCNAAAGYDPEKTPVAFGGFGYGSSLRPDLSNTWMALTALRAAGVEATDPLFKDALIFARRCQNSTEVNDLKQFAGEDGGSMYLPGDSFGVETKAPDGRKLFTSTGSMTSALLLAYQKCGLPADAKEVRLALGWLEKNASVDKNPGNKNDGQYALYYYYRTLAMALSGAGEKTLGGKVWARELSEAIVKRQREDGSWVNPVADESEGDPALVTGYALSALAECGK